MLQIISGISIVGSGLVKICQFNWYGICRSIVCSITQERVKLIEYIYIYIYTVCSITQERMRLIELVSAKFYVLSFSMPKSLLKIFSMTKFSYKIGCNLRVYLVGRVEKWKDRKLWEDGKVGRH